MGNFIGSIVNNIAAKIDERNQQANEVHQQTDEVRNSTETKKQEALKEFQEGSIFEGSAENGKVSFSIDFSEIGDKITDGAKYIGSAVTDKISDDISFMADIYAEADAALGSAKDVIFESGKGAVAFSSALIENGAEALSGFFADVTNDAAEKYEES